MKEEKERELFETLKNLPIEDRSEEEFGEEEVTGDYNIVDFWESTGKKLRIAGGFIDNVDLSYSRVGEITLVGRFNRVDLSKAVIKVLNIKEAEIIKLDLTEANIGQTIK